MRIKDKLILASFFFGKAVKVLRIQLAFARGSLLAKLQLALNGCHYGRSLRACGKVYFRFGSIGCLHLGDHVTLTARYLTNPVGGMPVMLECIGDARIEIGDHSGLSSTLVSARRSVSIGRYVSIGGNVRIFDHDFHSLDWTKRRPGGGDAKHVHSSAVVIEDDVFIGTGVIILKGVHIGARSIVAAGSVVTAGIIPPDSLVAGNPARVIRTMQLSDRAHVPAY